jgi:Tfp pilus assembly protein PilX
VVRFNGIESPARQRGITLLTGLVLLAATSLLALLATSSMLLQIRMSSNLEDSLIAQQNSRFAVSMGEGFLFSLRNDARLPDCLSGCFTSPMDSLIHSGQEIPPFPEHESIAWWQQQAVDAFVDPLTGLPVDQSWTAGVPVPLFLIQEMYFASPAESVPAGESPGINGIGYYRVLGRGSGHGPSAWAVSESIIARPWKSDADSESSTNTPSEFCEEFRPWLDCGRMAWRQRR